jgi:hypothetical protein
MVENTELDPFDPDAVGEFVDAPALPPPPTVIV